MLIKTDFFYFYKKNDWYNYITNILNKSKAKKKANLLIYPSNKAVLAKLKGDY
jgi:hypothetical protein